MQQLSFVYITQYILQTNESAPDAKAKIISNKRWRLPGHRNIVSVNAPSCKYHSPRQLCFETNGGDASYSTEVQCISATDRYYPSRSRHSANSAVKQKIKR